MVFPTIGPNHRTQPSDPTIGPNHWTQPLDIGSLEFASEDEQAIGRNGDVGRKRHAVSLGAVCPD